MELSHHQRVHYVALKEKNKHEGKAYRIKCSFLSICISVEVSVFY